MATSESPVAKAVTAALATIEQTHTTNLAVLIVFVLLVIANAVAHWGLSATTLFALATPLGAYLLGSFYTAGKHAEIVQAAVKPEATASSVPTPALPAVE